MSGKVGGSINLSVGFLETSVADEHAAIDLRHQIETELIGVVKQHFPTASPSVTVHLTFQAAPVEVEEPVSSTTGINTSASTGVSTTE